MKAKLRIAVLTLVVVIALIGAGVFAPVPVRTASRAATLSVSTECYNARADAFGERWQTKAVGIPSLHSSEKYEGHLRVEVTGLLRPKAHSRKATFVMASGEEVPVYNQDGFTTMECSFRPGENPFQPAAN
jgi:hypothetical protein